MDNVLAVLTEGLENGFLAVTGRVARMVSSVHCDIKDLGARYEVMANVSEYAKSEVKVTVKDGLLTISGEHLSDTEDKENPYLLKERITSNFKRDFKLPGKVVDEAVTAEWQNGLLKVVVPKVVEEKPQEPEEKEVEIK